VKINPIHFFQTELLKWFEKNGRQHLPWFNQEPYKVWLSEIMLQQTQVSTALPYFNKFIETFPTIAHLAQASEETVCQMWAGLGYYHRAKNLHRTAIIIHQQYQDIFPQDIKTLQTFPGIGPSTAAAIASLAFNLPHAILDGNVKRVLARYFGIETEIKNPLTTKKLKQLANACMPKINCQSYTQAIMDMGATCCQPKQPKCHHCPLNTACIAFKQNKINLIPKKSPKKEKPVLTYHFGAFVDDNKQIFLVKRPDKGIWPHLWCLPEFSPSSPVKAHFVLKHELTHQYMDIQIHLNDEKNQTLHGKWVSINDYQECGLPKPILAVLPKIFLVLK